MPTNLDRYKKDLEALLALGEKMRTDLVGRHVLRDKKLSAQVTAEKKKKFEELQGTFEREYQKWYTEASAVIRQMTPDRYPEFQALYMGDGKRKDTTAATYHIQDWLNGVRAGQRGVAGEKYYDDFGIVFMRFSTQHSILEAVSARFESSLHEITQIVQADLLDSEIAEARVLQKAGFLRAAGAVVGVVIEKHLAQVLSNHGLSTKKLHPSISDLNEILKGANVLDVPAWRNIQRLGDLRNLCDHNKHREPTEDDIQELIDGVEKVTKTLF